MKAAAAVRCLLAIVCACALGWAGCVPAQGYPSKPIRLIVPLAPGGPTDILARSMAQAISPSLGQPIVVDNRTGAAGTIGTDIAAKSPPDGHTLLLVAVANYTINASLRTKLPYDARKDLAPVIILAGAPYIFSVHPSLPVSSLKELIALARKHGKDLNYGSGGAGTGPQLAFELFKLRTGIEIVHIAYKGTGPALTEHVAGQTQVGLYNMIASLPFVRAGKLRAIAVNGAQRSPMLPDVPTMTESGIAGFEDVGGYLVMVPGGTPKEIVARLHQELAKALQSPDVLARLKSEGAEVFATPPDAAAAVIPRDLDKWAEVIKRTGIKPE